MGPNQTYDDFLQALRDGDPEIASHRCDDLARWIRSGGFIPAKLAKRNLETELFIRMLSCTAALLRLAARDIQRKEET